MHLHYRNNTIKYHLHQVYYLKYNKLYILATLLSYDRNLAHIGDCRVGSRFTLSKTLDMDEANIASMIAAMEGYMEDVKEVAPAVALDHSTAALKNANKYLVALLVAVERRNMAERQTPPFSLKKGRQAPA